MPAAFSQPIVVRMFRWLRVLLALYLLVLLVLMLFENRLIFVPLRHPAGDWRAAGLDFEDAWFTAPDGVRLHGWYLPHDQPRAVVLFAHGNGGNLTHRAPLLAALRRLGASVLIFDYRGYGRSEGAPSEAGVLADARAARAWLAERAGVPENQIVLCGESLGGAVQVDLAAADGARGLILLSTFNSLPDVAAYHFPWAPVRWLLRTRLDSEAKIRSYTGPLLQVHGDADRIVPLGFAEQLFAAANEPKQWIELPGHDHNDPLGPAVLRAIGQWLDGL